MLKRSLSVITIILMFLILLIFSLPDHSKTHDQRIKAVKGNMELSDWDMKSRDILRLDGEWEFYWKQLLTPSDFSGENLSKPELTGYMQVPSIWNGKAPGGDRLPAFGSATYRLVLENIPYHGVLGLKKGNARFSSKVYVNGEELLSDGVPALDSKEYKSGNTPQVGFFRVNDKKIEIIVQVSNYEYPNSGIPVSLELGSEKAMLYRNQMDYVYSMAVFAILLTIAFLYFNFFIVARFHGLNEYVMLLFSAFCILFALGNALADQRPLLLLLPNISFTLAFKLKDFFLTGNFIVMLWVFHKFKRGFMPPRLIRILSVAYGSFMIIILIFPIFIYIKIYMLVMVCNTIILSMLFIQSILLYIRKAEGFLLFVAILSVNFYSLDAILFSFGFKTSSGYLQVYMMIFAAVMTLLLSMQYFTAIKQRQDSIKQSQEAEIAFLRAQINPHFLYNALNSVVSLCKSAPDKAEEVVVELSQYLRGSFDFKQMDAMSTLDKELKLLEAYLYIEKTRFGDRLNVEYDLDETLNFRIPPLILQPLVENAVIHGLLKSIAGGTVKISILRQGNEAVFTVTDNGVGMERKQLDCLLEENPKTGGIGVWNINQRLKMLYNRGLSIKSEKGKGTQVSFSLPLSREEKQKKSFFKRK